MIAEKGKERKEGRGGFGPEHENICKRKERLCKYTTRESSLQHASIDKYYAVTWNLLHIKVTYAATPTMTAQ